MNSPVVRKPDPVHQTPRRHRRLFVGFLADGTGKLFRSELPYEQARRLKHVDGAEVFKIKGPFKSRKAAELFASHIWKDEQHPVAWYEREAAQRVTRGHH